MADVNQQEHLSKLLRLVQIILDHPAPLGLHFLVGPGIAIAGQIHEVNGIIHIIVIDGLGLPWLGTGPGQGLAVHQGIDQGRLSHIALPGKSHLREPVLGEFAGDTTHGLQTDILDNHKNIAPSIQYFRILPVTPWKTSHTMTSDTPPLQAPVTSMCKSTVSTTMLSTHKASFADLVHYPWKNHKPGVRQAASLPDSQQFRQVTELLPRFPIWLYSSSCGYSCGW